MQFLKPSLKVLFSRLTFISIVSMSPANLAR